MKAIGWSFGMQSRAASRVGADPDIEGLAEAVLKAGIKETIIFGKDHTGFCFYPTKIGVPHPKLQIDLTGAMTRELHLRGIRALAYLNFGMDGESGRKHHEWLQQSRPGEVMLTADHYADICPFSPYTEELLLPLMREMLELYNVDGFFLDTMSAFKICYCRYCREEFKKLHHREIPLAEDDPGWELYGKFQKQRSEGMIKHVREYVQALSPEASVIFNHMGGPAWPIEIPEIISCDPPANYPWISLYANFLSAGTRTGDVFIERFQRGWGDRSGLTDLTLEDKAASIFAHNQRFFVGDRLHSDGRFAPGSLKALEKISGLWQKMNQLMPPVETPRSPDVLVLYSNEKMFGPAFKFFGAIKFGRNWKPALGSQLLLNDAGCNFLQVPEIHLKLRLSANSLLILPEMQFLSAETDSIIRKFIVEGGRVLVVGTVPRLADGTIPDWLGIDRVETAVYQTCVYLPAWDETEENEDEERTVVDGDIHRCYPGAAAALLHGFSQYDLTLMGGGVNSAASEPDVHPLLTVNKSGKGQAFYFNAPIFTDYLEGLDQQRAWF
ncbi:MAG: hypothetical protein PHV59_11010, partial [Victivallales bacterium]|nr:hypothetical protein [Victivallales bacterium]